MASLNKLAIRGIRSFDDKQISVIEFFSPVTVIVGHNGSGKTTIIECLKYATTGDQPPNTRGGAFVHDPKMANEKEVKAQVKLRFHAANGTRMLAVRNLSVTMKKTAGLTMKTLESILALADGNADKGGKRGVISTKCAEMDAEIPQLLGVSKSVLENVIFCHQEDSYWPLAEPAALKKKFDDIFEATRYTKALDSIKALRKDRVAELKADKERLDSLSREKGHADKLKARISDLSSTISAKEIDHEETKKQYEALVISNQKFYQYATKFREIYLKVGNLQENKERFEAELEDAKENIQEIVGTDEELDERLRNFNDHILEQKGKRREMDSKRQDLEDEMQTARKHHMELVNQHGRLSAETKAQELRISDRESLIREISSKHGLKGYDHSPLERDKVIEFISRLGDLQSRQKIEFEKFQSDSRAKNDEYNRKVQHLRSELQGFKVQRGNLRDQIGERQASISAAENTLDGIQGLPSELRTLMGDIEEKIMRLEKMKSDVKDANYDEKLTSKARDVRRLEDHREELNREFQGLSMQAEARAKLDMKRGEVKSKTVEINNTLEIVNIKFRKIVGTEIHPDTMERELDRISAEKERDLAEMETQATDASKALQQAETTLTNSQAQLKVKREELKTLEKKLRNDVGDGSLEAAIKDASDEVNLRKDLTSSHSGSSAVYESMLKIGKQKKVCTTCNRHMNDKELGVFEKFLKEQIAKTSTEYVESIKQEVAEWAAELERLQGLLPVEASKNRLKAIEIPALEKQIREQEASIPSISDKAEDASNKLSHAKKELKDVLTLKPHASTVSRLQKELVRLKDEIPSIEKELSGTGSTKTAADVQEELNAISIEMRTNENDKQYLITERERQNNVIRTIETDLNEMKLNERDLTTKIRDKTILEERVKTMKEEVIELTRKVKEIDVKIVEGQAPIEQLEHQHQLQQDDLDTKISAAQRSYQNLNMSVDKLDSSNREIDRYVRDKHPRKLQDCATKIEEIESEIHELDVNIRNAGDAIAQIDKVINESGSAVSNLRGNLRIRKLMQDIAKTQAEIDSHDMEEAARSRRNFEKQYSVEKEKETELQGKYAHIGGEISSHKTQLKEWENDLKEFKDVYQRYTDQLIRVKMSDMANSDLEKYAKALDNAIMKYHGLKMEEVNDSMRHLWNKTYQGTDIDGIKIRSDVEGGASKRSYNYRVVMTKDQVEMDMRGRCSAGQKMLASIIIRLALSDSFGQNCGILALDEPTNALDTENIDALAASLVDIINERKNHSNFQLIIITHDENFLRKLGQSDVMEYYWRVSRDARQKSVIERQRFR